LKLPPEVAVIAEGVIGRQKLRVEAFLDFLGSNLDVTGRRHRLARHRALARRKVTVALGKKRNLPPFGFLRCLGAEQPLPLPLPGPRRRHVWP
jgi:hypothetical protein